LISLMLSMDTVFHNDPFVPVLFLVEVRLLAIAGGLLANVSQGALCRAPGVSERRDYSGLVGLSYRAPYRPHEFGVVHGLFEEGFGARVQRACPVFVSGSPGNNNDWDCG